MKNISGKELCKLLEENGWELKRIHGSHFIYVKTGRKERISVPVHAGKTLKVGLLNKLMKMAGI